MKPNTFPLVTVEPLSIERDGKFYPIESHVANVLPDGTQVGIVKNTYNIIQMRDIVDQMNDTLSSIDGIDLGEIQVEDIVSRDGAFVARQYVRPTKDGIEYKNDRTTGEVGTTVSHFMRMSTSYDGSSPTRFRSGALDLVCTNGMVSQRDQESFFKRHTKNATIERFSDLITTAVERHEMDVEQMRQFASTDLPSQEKLMEAMQSFPRNSELFIKRMMERVEQEVEERGANLYAFLSALTFYSSHDSEHFPVVVKKANDGRNIPELVIAREEQVRTFINSKAFARLANQ